MISTRGYQNEIDLIEAMDNKKVEDLDNNLRHLVVKLFDGKILKDDIVRSYKTDDYMKPDIIIQVGSKKHFVSVKCGDAYGVHEENINSFLYFLKNYGVSDEILDIIRKFHYGDGTLDGTGQIRKATNEVFFEMRDEIQKANDALRDVNLVKAVVDRCLFTGINTETQPADCLYHGDIQYGEVMTRNQVMKQIEVKNWLFLDRCCLHIGPIALSTHARYANKPIRSEELHHKIKFQWYHLFNDVRYIGQRYNTYVPFNEYERKG